VHVLLEQYRTKPRVERAKPLLAVDLPKPTDQAARELGVADQPNARRLERAQRNVGEEFGHGGGREVDGSTVVRRVLVAEHGDSLLLEELIAAEFEGALEEVAGSGWAEARQEGAGAFIGNDLAEATDEAAVVGYGVELDAGFDAVDLASCQ